MLARALILVPLLLATSFGPGFFFIRRLRWSPLETLAGSIALSLILVFALAFGVYWAGLPSAAYFGVTAITAVLTGAALADISRFVRIPRVGRTLLPFGLLVVWTLGVQAIIRHYSGGDWCCDWLEHYQRSLFFLERWPKDSVFLGRYLLTERPPFMNVVSGYFLAIVGKDFALYQIVFSLLNLLLFFPCCLFARAFAPKSRGVPALVATFLGANPFFFMNTTFAWTKVLAAVFVILSVWFYLAGWRKRDPLRMSAAFLCVAAGMLVHFSTGPYAVVLAVLYLVSVWPSQRRRVRTLAIVAAPAAALVAIWFAWSLSALGVTATLMRNVSVESASSMTLGGNLARIAHNTFHTFWPYLFPGRPDDSPLRLLTDRAFTFYQENFLGAVGPVSACVAIWLAGVALFSRRTPLSRRERRFWMTFIPATLLIGIAVDGETTPSGFANICLQPLVYLAVTLVAARFITLGRGVRVALLCGLIVDFILGVALEAHMESRMDTWARTPNWDLKADNHLIYLGDVFRASGVAIEIALAAAAALVFYRLARVTFAAGPE